MLKNEKFFSLYYFFIDSFPFITVS